ncbi:hypothetical protein [Ensifer sp. 4252]
MAVAMLIISDGVLIWLVAPVWFRRLWFDRHLTISLPAIVT